jgi:hypothetical protein
LPRREFANQKALIDYAERNALAYAWEGSHAFAKRQRLRSPKQYEIVEVRTSRGMDRALLFSKAILLAEWEANAPYARRWQSSASDGGPKRAAIQREAKQRPSK